MKIYRPQPVLRLYRAQVRANSALRARTLDLLHDLAAARQEARDARAEAAELRAMLAASIDDALARCLEDGAA